MSIYITLTANQNRLKPRGKHVYNVNITIKMHYYNKYLINFYEMFSRPQATQLTRHGIQLLIIFLKVSKFSADSTWCGIKFHILFPKLLRLLVP